MGQKSRLFCLLFLLILGLGCAGVGTSGTGSGSSSDDSSDDSTGGPTAGPPSPPAEIPAIEDLPERIRGAAIALIPEIGETESSEAPTTPASSSGGTSVIDYNTELNWAEFFEPFQNGTLDYIFGDPDVEGQIGAESQLRFILNLFAEHAMATVLREDPTATCEIETAAGDSDFSLLPLTDGGDEIEIAFYGNVDNGPSTDRFFDCIATDSMVYGEGTTSKSDAEITLIYGRDEAGVVRLALMEEEEGDYVLTSENTDTLKVRKSVYYATYGETASENSAYIDIQYASVSNHSGNDHVYGAGGDDTFFKSRSRITGHVEYEDISVSDRVSTLSQGEFTVTAYNDGVLADTDFVTKGLGRGGYANGDFSLFNFDSNSKDELADSNGIYCIEAKDTSPVVEDDNRDECYDRDPNLETAYSWGSEEFPFSISDLETNFLDKDFFETSDLITDSMGNFAVPAY
ncbi:MAG: hypothetical protein Q7T11_07390 [Deltaproteobacteria bacterium]|nr:hypothetical protein [Deltaproteobacteria bacterium]